MARKRATSCLEGSTTKRIKATDNPTPPLRRSTRVQQAREAQNAAFDDGDGEEIPAKSVKGKTKARTSAKVAPAPQKAPSKSNGAKDDSSKSAKGKMKAHTPAKRTKETSDASEQIQNEDPTPAAFSDDEDVEELPAAPRWPRYKDDLPNAFNGDVDPEKDFISKAPVEAIDNIISFLILDHEPDQGVEIKAKAYKARPHVLLSMAAMSRLFYHATEGFARRFLTRNKDKLKLPWETTEYHIARQAIEEKRNSNRRRSARIASKPQLEVIEHHRKELITALRCRCAVCFSWGYNPGKFANQVSVCGHCERAEHGRILTLTDALKSYDLRDYMLIKSRNPGPRAKFTDLPAILYGSVYKSLGFPAFRWSTIFWFREKDVSLVADLVHGDVVKHMQEKNSASKQRQQKARTKRVREFIIRYHEDRLEITSGKAAERHDTRLKELRALAPDVQEPGVRTRFGCNAQFCYHDIGLCDICGDVPGRRNEDCYACHEDWVDRRYEEQYARYRVVSWVSEARFV